MAKRIKEKSACFVNPRSGWKAWQKITLWSRCAGRCERCNESVVRNRYSGDEGNFAEFAHIIAHSDGGNRSNKAEDYTNEYVDSIDNIIVLCTSCHTDIDKKENETKYTEEYLQGIKNAHIEKIYYQTLPDNKERRHVIIFTCPIGAQEFSISDDDTREAMFPTFAPKGERAIRLKIGTYRAETDNRFWENSQDELIGQFRTQVLPLLKEGVKFAVFAIAPMPLLVQLGVLSRGTNSTIIYNLFRRQTEKWKWKTSDMSNNLDFRVNRYIDKRGITVKKALIVAISANITERVINGLPQNSSVWEITIDNPMYDSIRSIEQLSNLGRIYLQILEEAAKFPGSELDVYMAAPNSAAVMLGMSHMPKCNDSLVIHDYIGSQKQDIKTIKLLSL